MIWCKSLHNSRYSTPWHVRNQKDPRLKCFDKRREREFKKKRESSLNASDLSYPLICMYIRPSVKIIRHIWATGTVFRVIRTLIIDLVSPTHSWRWDLCTFIKPLNLVMFIKLHNPYVYVYGSDHKIHNRFDPIDHQLRYSKRSRSDRDELYKHTVITNKERWAFLVWHEFIQSNEQCLFVTLVDSIQPIQS